MHQIIPNLWLGDFISAIDTKALKSNGIGAVLSVMKGEMPIHPTFIRHQIEIDDTSDDDILTHLIPAVQFIQSQLDKKRGVLVHCQAGISRSPTVVAAYLMFNSDIDSQTALKQIQEIRLCINPNPGFVSQLDMLHASNFSLSEASKDVRMFYVKKRTNEAIGKHSTITNAPAKHLSVNNRTFTTSPVSSLSSLSNTAGDDVTATNIRSGDAGEGGTLSNMFTTVPASDASRRRGYTKPIPRTRIRCKMCRQELATREDMLDHGQLWPLDSNSDPEEGGEPSGAPERVLLPPGPISSIPPPAAAQIEGDPIAQANPDMIPGGTTIKAIALAQTTPILINSKCSGYFLEPMEWMQPFLHGGPISGKIACQTASCKAKLGNYNWAGMRCGCGQWVVPGFCVNRSKVDEMV